MTCKFLDFRRKQDIKFREMDREMRCPIHDLRETHQSSLLGSVPWRKVDHYHNRF